MSAVTHCPKGKHCPPATQQLTEQVLDWSQEGVQIDRAERVVRNVALAGQFSRNGYEYDSSALEEAVSLYEGKPVFLDHAYPHARRGERSARDLIGSIENVSYRDERVRGDIRVLDTESGRTFLALAESAVDVVGMSHVVLAERTPDRKRVVRIHEVLSVDVVVSPATTAGLSEGLEGDQRGLQPGMSLIGSWEMVLRQLDHQLETQVGEIAEGDYERIERVALFERHLVTIAERNGRAVGLVLGWSMEEGRVCLSEEYTEVRIEEIELGTWRDREDLPRSESESTEELLPRLQVEVTRLQQENAALDEELTAVRATLDRQLRECDWRRQMEAMGMPAEGMTEVFCEQLAATNDDTRRLELMRERAQLWKRARRLEPRSLSRIADVNEGRNRDEEFVRLVRAA